MISLLTFFKYLCSSLSYGSMEELDSGYSNLIPGDMTSNLFFFDVAQSSAHTSDS